MGSSKRQTNFRASRLNRDDRDRTKEDPKFTSSALALGNLLVLSFPFLDADADGNHDDRENFRQGLRSFPGVVAHPRFVQYAVEDYPLRLIGLDTHIPQSSAGELCEERLSWFEKTLATEYRVMNILGEQTSVRLDDETFISLYVPAGMLHGFQALTEQADVCYRIDREHDPAEDLAVRYDDADLAIAWPRPATVVSARDAGAGSWAHLKSTLERSP